MLTSKKALLLCYSFPPFPGIGGRRWAKFSKYLSRKWDIEFFVLGAKNRGIQGSNWKEDVINNPKIIYHPLSTLFFRFYHRQYRGLFGKIWFKLTHFYLRVAYKGNYFDKSLPSIDLFYKASKNMIIEHDIKNIIITIAPYRLVEVGIKLKSEFPELNFIMDIRDPWNILLEDWDHKHLNEKRKKKELKVEIEAVSKADVVFSVCQVVLDFYKLKLPNNKNNLVLLPNGYDTEEILNISRSINSSEVKYFLYAGILYDTSIVLFEEFVQQVSLIKKQFPLLLKDIEFHFYISEPIAFKNIVKKNQLDCIRFFGQVSLLEIQNIIAGSIGCMLFLPPKFEFSLSTKFYEYILHNKKLLLFSSPGEVSDIVRKNNLGYVMHPGNMKEPLCNALKDYADHSYKNAHTFNIAEHSVEKLAEKIVPYLK